jgi:hypothetical protein
LNKNIVVVLNVAIAAIITNAALAVVTLKLFFFLLLRCFFISLPSTNIIDKRISLIEETGSENKELKLVTECNYYQPSAILLLLKIK